MEIQEQVSTALKGMQDEFGKLTTELKEFVAKEVAEKAKTGQAEVVTVETIQKLEKGIGDLEVKMNAEFKSINAELSRPSYGRRGGEAEVKSIGQRYTEDEGFKKWVEHGFRAINGRKGYTKDYDGFFPVGQKAIIRTSDLGLATTGVIPLQREPGIDQLPRQELRIRDILDVRPMTGGQVDYMKQNVFTNAASPQTEGSSKAESTVTYTSAVAIPKDIAHFIQITKQALADVPGIEADIDSLLMYGLKLKEESEVLFGDNLGSHLHGIAVQAASRSTSYDVVGDTKLDRLRHAILQARLALFPVDAVVMNPKDLHDIDLIKTEEGGSNKGVYILGDPRNGSALSPIWGKRVVESDSMTAGYFLVGAFQRGATLYDRMQATIDISFENGTNFVENEATIRCEERVALAVRRTTAFVYGQFA